MHNWAGNVAFSTADVRRPGSLEELQHVVRKAVSVHTIGTGHSFNNIADTVGTLVSVQELPTPIEIVESRSIAIVPGGATYAQVASALHEQGWALHNLGSLPHISVAGACASGTHGSGVNNGCLATAAVGVELVRGDGELVEVHEGHPDFPGTVLNLGALGVVTRIWLKVEPTFTVSQEVVLDVPFSTAVEQADTILASAYSVSIFSTFATPGSLDSVWRKHRLDQDGNGPWPTETWGGRPADADMHPLLGLDARAATEQQRRPGPWHHRLPHFRMEFTPSVGDELQSEFFLPLEHAGASLAALGEAAPGFRDALQVFEMRTVAADDLWLSPFQRRDSVAVHATWLSNLAVVRPALTALEAAIAPFGPRPHWGKVFLGFDADRLADLYPMTARFRELSERLDPQRCFVNEYLQRLGLR